MSELDAVLERLSEHDGVEDVILLGRDGLLVQHVGLGSKDVEAVAARVPGLVSASAALGGVAGQGDIVTAVLEFDTGVAVVMTLSGDLLLAVLLRAGVGFAPLLRELRQGRARLVELL